MRRLGKTLAASLMSLSLVAGLFAGAGGHPVYAAESDPNRYEMEDGELTGAAEAYTDDEGVGYVYIQGTTDSITLKVNAEKKGMYDLSISYRLPKAMGDVKVQYVLINGKTAGNVSFTATEEWRDLDIGSFLLNEGENTVTIQAYWGWMHLDALTVKESNIPELVGNTELSDKEATAETQGLMNYLATMYGNHVLTGQQENCDSNRETEIDYIKETTGKAPAIRAFDFLNYNPLFHYDDGTTERMIEWANEKGGIVTASYHWFCPADMSEYELGERVEWADSAFYVNGAGGGVANTNFDVTKVSDTTSLEYQYVMLSLKDLATELLKLQEAGVPVLFRPLHEAGGSGTSDYSGEWFWWAAKGPEAYKNLWKLVYTTLTEEYGLHNLIWEFNAYAKENSYEWYPGDEYVDIIAYDKYNADNNGPNESALSATYYSLVKMYQGKKMVTMAECDTIPSVENLENEETHWLYVCPWYGDHILSSAKNNPETLKTIYNSDLFITLDEVPEYKTYEAVIKPEDPTTEDTAGTTSDVQTTQNPAGTTSDVQTTQNPAGTTSDVQTTQNPADTTSGVQTTQNPAGTTAGVQTTQDASNTTASVPTTETTEGDYSTTAGVQNTEDITNTTQAPSGTTSQPSGTTHSHSYTSNVVVMPTCTNDGIMSFTCNCGDAYTEVIKAFGHMYTDSVIAPTENELGYTEHICAICGDSYKDSYVPALGHSNHTYTSAVTKAATCTVDGERTYTCSCGETYTEVIKAAGHSYTDTVVEPTEQEKGYTKHVCSICGDTYTDTYTTYDKPHTHSYTSKVTVIPTCQTDGVMTFTCSCGEVYTETAKATGHTWKQIVNPASQTAAGSYANECSKCGEQQVTKAIPAIASITLSANKYVYNGSIRTPIVKVMDTNGNVLIDGTDYTIVYDANRKNVGQYNVTVNFQGNYTGSYTTSFVIVPKATALRSIKRASKSMKVTWKKQKKQVTGYQIQYSQYKSFKSAKKVNVKSYKKISATIKKLKENKKYYVRIRTYKTAKINGVNKKIYSAWSKAKVK